METNLLPIFAILVVLFGMVALIFGLRLSRSSELDRRLQDYVIEPVTTRPRFGEETFDRRPEISGSFLTRTIVPFFRGLGLFFSRLIPGGSTEVRAALAASVLLAGGHQTQRTDRDVAAQGGPQVDRAQ